MAVEIKSYNQILGEMIRKLVADTSLNDINTGSTILSLLEAAAQVDFENNASILSVLDLLNIDATRNNDLDLRAADFGLVRTPAQRATGFVNISDTNITKRSSGLYQVKPAPIAGSTQLFVNDASEWSQTGELFIGRGTPNFEGPISYTSIVNNGTFFTINLGSSLEKDHLISEFVIDAQGTQNRLIPSGTTVQIPANNVNPVVEFRTLRNAVIPSGETEVTGVEIVAVIPGTSGNAGINTIVSFQTSPFTGAAVTNTTALTNGTDVESDVNFRERIKSYASTLARGTEAAILSAIIGVSDPDDGKQVASAVIQEPPRLGDPSILYIDDGSGFEPTYTGQSVDVLLNEATGDEEFLQLANFPLPRPQVVNTADGPYELSDQMQLRVIVDNVEEAVTFTTSQFSNITAATLAEIIIAINDQATTFKATFTENKSRILIFPTDHTAETIRVAAIRIGDDPLLFANNVLKFPTNEFSYIRLYQNNQLLTEKSFSATVLSTAFPTWNITDSGSLIISVDGTPPQERSFSTFDFGGAPFAALTLSDWVDAFNKKFAGVTAVGTSSGRLQLTSNKDGSGSSIAILGGSYFDKLFSGQTLEATGKNSDFQLNRQNGNLRILTEIEPGDSITAGIEDAKGAIISTATPTGSYNVATDANGRPSRLIIAADSDAVTIRVGIGLAIGNVITVTDQGSDVMRLTSDSAASFAAIVPGDMLFIASRGAASSWINPANTGIFKIISKGEHTTPNVNTYIEVKNVGIIPGVHAVEASEDIQAFRTETYPQVWKGTFVSTPASIQIQPLVDSFNNNLINSITSVFKTSSLKLTSTTENNGSIAIPAGSGNALSLFDLVGKQLGTEGFVASRTADRDFVTFYKWTGPTSEDAEGQTGKTVWLDRVQYSDIRGNFTASTEPGEFGVDTYSEELQSTGVLTPANLTYDDIINYLEGSNKGHYRVIRDYLPADTVGTQHALPRTVMDISSGEEFNLMRSSSISAEDSIVFILDQDPVAKTIDIRMSRTGRVNSLFPSTQYSFSADDADNEPGINFANLQVWGKSSNKTEFQDYAVWFRARNWYVSGGAGSSGGSFMVRAKEYGPHGEKYRFNITYPTSPNLEADISHDNDPDFSLVTYTFGSGPAKPVGIVDGAKFSVSNIGGDDYRLKFVGSPSFASVAVNDVLSILPGAGVSAANSGQYSIKAVNDLTKEIDIYNPNGVTTTVGSPEVTTVDTVADIAGSATVSTISNIAAAAAGLDGEFFVINDAFGSVAVYYNVGTPSPGPGALGVDRVLEITLTGAESDVTVASLTSGVIGADSEFSSISALNSITVTNLDNGAIAIAADGSTPTGFTFSGSAGSASVSLDGKYFILQDSAGSVAFWYDVSGTTSMPLHGADRSIEITTANAGDSADIVATKTAVAIVNDPAFATATITAPTNRITVTDAANGVRPAASAGNTGFTVAQSVAGVDDGYETISDASDFFIFNLLGTGVSDIVSTISEGPLLVAAAINDSNDIVKATREEEYTPAGPSDFSASLSFEHDPDPLSGKNQWINLFDSIAWVKDFDNLNPNFTLKNQLVLPGAAPLAYTLESTPNEDSTTGEYFKLVPTTLQNLLHHFTQKALSQLPIVADVAIADNIRRIQIKSKLLGSNGAVEIVGGNANEIEFSIFGEGQVAPGSETGKNYLQVKTRAFPTTLTKGMLVEIQNTQPAKRLSRLKNSDTIDVFKGAGDDVEYRWNAKDTKLTSLVRFTVTDVSASYGRPAGVIWRWEHSDSGSFYNITDLTLGVPGAPVDDEISAGGVDAANLYATVVDAGTLTTYQNFRLTVGGVPTQGDYYTFRSASGESFALWFSVDGNNAEPTGATYLAVAVSNRIRVDILSTDSEDQIISKLAATLNVNVQFLSEFSGFQEEGANFDDANAGDLLNVYGTFGGGWPSDNTAYTAGDGNIAGFPIIAVNSNSRWVDVVNPKGAAMTDQAIGNSGSVTITPTPVLKWNIKHEADQTRYKIESLGFNDLYRLSWVDGPSPQFVDCGVAVDDFMTIRGSTFSSSNSGIFRVLGVDNTSIIYQNPVAREELDTYIPFNDSAIPVNWTSNLDLVTGTAGSFQNVEIGDWVKKGEDSDSEYRQVIDFLDALDDPTTPALATKIRLGSNYEGATSTSLGISFDQNSDVGKGKYLRDGEDIRFFEGDSVQVGDSIFIDNIANIDWFSSTNSGLFEIIQFGTSAVDARPFVRVRNTVGLSQSNRKVSVAPLGFFILEGQKYVYSSIRQIEHTAIDDFNPDRRSVYMVPPTKVDKISDLNGTLIRPIGKIGYSTDITTGIDGYSYYTGLLRTVQRIIDGFEPEAATYPGRRAVGGAIEILPPLIRRVVVSLEVTTNEGVNLNEISNDIKSTIIDYVSNLGVGDDVILSEIIVAVMDITGVAAVTFNSPDPSTERISISDNEKAFIEPDDISVA